MKRLIPYILLMAICTPMSLGAFDYTISDTFVSSVNLNNQSLLVTGAGTYQIDARGSSYIEIQDTAPLSFPQNPGGIVGVLLDDNSSMNFYDGELSGMNIYDNATATFSGGRIDYLRSYQSILGPNQTIIKHITFICDVDSVNLTGNLLTGDWLDGSSFSITLQNQSSYDPVIDNIQFIPEPTTICFMGIGLLLLKKRRTS